jgi:hypothetical protein
LLTYLAAASLDRMHVETPIRAGNTLGKARRPLSQKSLGQREDTVAHGGNHGSQLNESSSRASNGHGIDREERLLRRHRPERGGAGRSPKRGAGPTLRDGIVAVERTVHDGGPDFQHRMSAPRRPAHLESITISGVHGPANSPPEAGSIRHLRPVNSPPLGRRHRAVRRG